VQFSARRSWPCPELSPEYQLVASRPQLINNRAITEVPAATSAAAIITDECNARSAVGSMFTAGEKQTTAMISSTSSAVMFFKLITNLIVAPADGGVNDLRRSTSLVCDFIVTKRHIHAAIRIEQERVEAL
jgi:hypothetical protein